MFPKLERLELFAFTVQGKHQISGLGKELEDVREKRPTLAELMLHGCKMEGETFESVFGTGNVGVQEL